MKDMKINSVKNYSIFALIFVFVSLVCLILNGMVAFQSTPKNLLDQTKETILIIALEKTYIIGENRKWIVWEANNWFCIFGKIVPNRLSKIIQRVCNLVFHILWELCVQILKNHEDKEQKDRYWSLFPCLLYALFQMECSLPKCFKVPSWLLNII